MKQEITTTYSGEVSGANEDQRWLLWLRTITSGKKKMKKEPSPFHLEKIINHSKNCIAEVANYLLFVMGEAALFSFFPDQAPRPGIICLLGLVPLLFYLIRCKIHKFWLFALLHIIPLVLILGAPFGHLAQSIVFFAVALVQAILSMSVRIAVYTHPERSDYGMGLASPIVAVIIAAAIYLLRGVAIIPLLTMAFIACFFLDRFLKHFIHYTDMSRRTTGHMPTKSIFAACALLVGGFTLLVIIMMGGFAGRLFIVRIGAWLLELLRLFIVWLIGLIVIKEQVAEMSLMGEGEVPPIPGEITELAEEGTHILVEILNVLFSVFATIVTVALVVGLIYGLVQLIRAAFRRRARESAQAVDKKKGDIIEKLPRREKAGPKRARVFLSNDEKIRRIFAATMSRQSRKRPADAGVYRIVKSSTAREMLGLFVTPESSVTPQCSNAGPPESSELPRRVSRIKDLRDDGINPAALISLYEKARYAAESCDNADARTARKLARQIMLG